MRKALLAFLQKFTVKNQIQPPEVGAQVPVRDSSRGQRGPQERKDRKNACLYIHRRDPKTRASGKRRGGLRSLLAKGKQS